MRSDSQRRSGRPDMRGHQGVKVWRHVDESTATNRTVGNHPIWAGCCFSCCGCCLESVSGPHSCGMCDRHAIRHMEQTAGYRARKRPTSTGTVGRFGERGHPPTTALQAVGNGRNGSNSNEERGRRPPSQWGSIICKAGMEKNAEGARRRKQGMGVERRPFCFIKRERSR